MNLYCDFKYRVTPGYLASAASQHVAQPVNVRRGKRVCTFKCKNEIRLRLFALNFVSTPAGNIIQHTHLIDRIGEEAGLPFFPLDWVNLHIARLMDIGRITTESH